jgi:hypothetical protein
MQNGNGENVIVVAPASDLNCGLDCHCFEKAQMTGEQTFTLRAQDRSSARTVAFWILENIETAPEEKLRHALEDAFRMRRWPTRKLAD